MRYLLKQFVIVAFGISILLTGKSVYAEQTVKHVLIVYDSYGTGTSKEGNVDSLKRLLNGIGVDLTVIDSENYEKGKIDDYPYVIILRNKDEQTAGLQLLMKDMEKYEGNYLHIGDNPSFHLTDALQLTLHSKLSTTVNLTIDGFSNSVQLSSDDVVIEAYSNALHTYGMLESEFDGINTPLGLKSDKYAYLSFYNQADISEWTASYLLRDWLDITKEGNLYVLLTDVYPFSNLEKLREASDVLYEAGIPFVLSSKPLFNNFDYPAAQRYAETLKYVQSRNGTIIVDAPAISYTISDDVTVLRGNISSYIDFLASNGIAPLGASAEMYWFEDSYYTAEGLAFYDSTVILPNVKVMRNQQINMIEASDSSLYSIPLHMWKQYATQKQLINEVPINIALTINVEEDFDKLDEQLQWLSGTWYQFHDYKTSTHRVTTEQNVITSNQGILKVNDTFITLQQKYTDVASEYTYIEEQEASLEKFFTFQNQVLIILIIIILIIFGVLLIIGYRMYRKKYVR